MTSNRKVKLQRRYVLLLFLMSIIALSGYLPIYAGSIAPPSGSHIFSCYGYVRSTTGDLLGYSTVKLTGGDPETGFSKTTTANSQGYYTISITTNLYVMSTIIASKSGYVSQSKSVYSKGSIQVDFSLTSLTHTFTCRGLIRDYSTGYEISGATVKLSSPTSGGPSVTTTSDIYGSYSITITTAEYKNYNLIVSKAMYQTEYTTVYSSGGTHTVDLTLLKCFQDDFESYSLGSNPNKWIVRETEGVTSIMIVDSSTEELYYAQSRKLVKIFKLSDGLFSDFLSAYPLNLDTDCPILVSFQIIGRSLANYIGGCSIGNGALTLLFYKDGIELHQSSL